MYNPDSLDRYLSEKHRRENNMRWVVGIWTVLGLILLVWPAINPTILSFLPGSP